MKSKGPRVFFRGSVEMCSSHLCVCVCVCKGRSFGQETLRSVGRQAEEDWGAAVGEMSAIGWYWGEGWMNGWNRMLGTWRIIPFSKWLVTPIHKPFRPFGRGTTLLGGLTNHGYYPLTNWDDPPSMEWLNLKRIFCHVNPNYPSTSPAESEERHALLWLGTINICKVFPDGFRWMFLVVA